MSQPTTAPLLAGLPPLLAELRAAAELRRSTPTNQTVGLALTPKQMQDWDEKSLQAWSRLA
jgi:hypothetical protein